MSNPILKSLNHDYIEMQNIHFIDKRDKDKLTTWIEQDNFNGCSGIYLVEDNKRIITLEVAPLERECYVEEFTNILDALQFFSTNENNKLVDFYIEYINDFKEEINKSNIESWSEYEVNFPFTKHEWSDFIEALNIMKLDSSPFYIYQSILQENDSKNFSISLIDFIRNKGLDDLVRITKINK
jgi:hypothetical protein